MTKPVVTENSARLEAELLAAQAKVAAMTTLYEQALDDRAEAMAALREDGWTVQRIADVVGVSKQLVSQVLSRTRP